MTITAWAGREDAADRRLAVSAGGGASRGLRRGLLLATLAASAISAAFATGSAETAGAVASTGGELTHLLRFMALIKAAMAVGVLGAVWWRLALPATAGRLLAYLAAGGAMAAGPVLIWDMAHVGLGALLLHGGLFGATVALWRDPAVADKLGAMIAARQRALRE